MAKVGDYVRFTYDEALNMLRTGYQRSIDLGINVPAIPAEELVGEIIRIIDPDEDEFNISVLFPFNLNLGIYETNRDYDHRVFLTNPGEFTIVDGPMDYKATIKCVATGEEVAWAEAVKIKNEWYSRKYLEALI